MLFSEWHSSVTFNPHSASRDELMAEVERLRGRLASVPIAPPLPDGGVSREHQRAIAEMRAEAANHLRAARRIAREASSPHPEGEDLAARLRRSEAARIMSEERLSLAFEASGSLGWWDWDLTTDKVYAGPYFASMFGVSEQEAEEGVPLELFASGIHPDDRERVALAIGESVASGGDYEQDYRLYRPATDEVIWVHARGRAYLDKAGRPLRFPGVAIDITAFRESEERKLALAALGERLRDMHDVGEIAFAAAETMAVQLNATRAGVGVVDAVQETVTMQPDWRMPGIASIAGLHHFRDYGSFIDDLKRGEIVLIEDTRRDPRTTGHHASLEAIGIRVLLNVPIIEHGQLSLVLFVHANKLRSFSEADLRFVRSVADRTHAAIGRSRAEERERLLNRELSHRLKNTLAMVQAIASQTLRNAPDMATARETLGSRLAALSRAHDLLLGPGQAATEIGAVAHDTLALHDDGQNRIRLSGPSVRLDANAALSLALILHELATNAAKYGALSVPEGTVDLHWEIDHQDGADLFHLVWRERGGPSVTEPTRRGFGSRLVERGLPGAVSGSVEQRFEPGGLVCRMEAPLGALHSSDG